MREGNFSKSFLRNKSFASQHLVFESVMSFFFCFVDPSHATLSPLIRYRQTFCHTAIRKMMLIRTFRLIARESKECKKNHKSHLPCAANDHCYRFIYEFRIWIVVNRGGRYFVSFSSESRSAKKKDEKMGERKEGRRWILFSLVEDSQLRAARTL